jgi:hypothetical protein
MSSKCLHCPSRRRIAFLAALVLLASLFEPQSACAEPQDSAKTTDNTSLTADAASALEPVLVTSHYDGALETSDTASEGTIKGALLQDMPLLRPGEVLETVPGLVVTQHSGDGKANQYFLRGYNLDHGTDFATSIDGVPVNLPSNAHGQGYSDLNYLIPELVDRIDYFKGPYFARTGDFSAAGSADIQYRTKLDQNFASLTVGAFDYRRVLLAGSTQLADSGPSLLGAVETENYNGPWTLPEDLHKFNGLLRLSGGSRASGWSIEGTDYNAQWNSTDQVPLSLIQSGALGRYSALDPSDGGDTGREILSAEWHAHDDAGYTRLTGYAQHYGLQLFSDFSFFELRPATGDQFEQWEHRSFVGSELLHGWDHGLFGRESVTEAGLQLRYDRIHVGLLNTEDRIAFADVSDDEIRESEAGAYLQNSTRWSPWLRSLAGVREQLIFMNVDSAVLAQNSGTASGHRLLPKLSLIFGPWRQTEFFVNWGQGFHSNDARGVVERIDPTTRLPASPVPALVGATGKEIGVRTQAIDGLESSLALWSLDSESELVYNADSSIGSTSPNGASRREGVEWNNHMAYGRHLLFDADLALTRARYAVANDNGQAGDRIPNAVGKVGRARATVQNLGPWSMDVESRFIGSYPLAQDGAHSTPSATVFNLRVSRSIAPGFDISLQLLNALNRQYFDIAYQQDYRTSPQSPVVPDGVTVHPGEPRELRLGARIAF